MMRLVAEIGSTTTVVTAVGGARFLKQAFAPTTPDDVTRGLAEARRALGLDGPLSACSSAAGGLKMTVHGLVYDMTARAAREAALGAGAVVHLVTAGEISSADLAAIRRISPRLVLLAGGVDGGERRTVVENARRLAPLGLPVIYAGNAAARAEVLEHLPRAVVVENVYPRIDELNVEPCRLAIQAAFERHITEAPGMARVREMVAGRVLPVPGAVMAAARLLAEEIGDLVVLDVGGATTDVHSVTDGSPEIGRLLTAPEPRAKRTVEGDLGVYVSAPHVARRLGIELRDWPPIPRTAAEVELAGRLTRECAETALARHAGRLRHLYGPGGRRTVAEGKDLTGVRWIIGTGGPLTRLAAGPAILAGLRRPPGEDLWPGETAQVGIDRQYIMAACGVLAQDDPAAALALLRQSLGV